MAARVAALRVAGARRFRAFYNGEGAACAWPLVLLHLVLIAAPHSHQRRSMAACLLQCQRAAWVADITARHCRCPISARHYSKRHVRSAREFALAGAVGRTTCATADASRSIRHGLPLCAAAALVAARQHRAKGRHPLSSRGQAAARRVQTWGRQGSESHPKRPTHSPHSSLMRRQTAVMVLIAQT